MHLHSASATFFSLWLPSTASNVGFDLTSESGAERRVSGAGWALLLNVAESYGWSPLGSQAPDGARADEWSGDYDSNDGQRVTREDAASMAEAFAAALTDPERHARQAAISRELDRAVHAMEIEAFGEDEVGPYVENPDPEVVPDDLLRDFIGFLRAGAFRIN